ncbi:MAG: sulfurtransferase [Gammaproteobacteria bacterium]|nr:sulfurtransferase [Gammaproteobacteria bacterium]
MFTTLISAKDLFAHINDPEWIVFDCRFTLTETEAGRYAYQQSHVPGAIYVHLDEDMSSPVTQSTGRHPLPDVKAFSEKLSAWGVDGTKQVVVYDDVFGAVAGRMWWLLRWMGHTQVALLDGGLPVWQREKYPVQDQLPALTPSTFIPNVNHDLLVDTDFVESSLSDNNIVIIDARAEQRFLGEVEPLDKVAGHVPGAISMPYDDNLAVSSNFETPEELFNLYNENINQVNYKKVIHMCGSGVTACHNILAMEHAGMNGSRLYAGSWSEWITNPQRPVVVSTDC